MTETARNKRLDELFAEEPHLSPTMKARRLHEKLETAQKAGCPPIVPPLPGTEKIFAPQRVSLKRAAEILRNSADWTAPTDLEMGRLFRFRAATLTRWLADAPELRRSPTKEGGRKSL